MCAAILLARSVWKSVAGMQKKPSSNASSCIALILRACAVTIDRRVVAIGASPIGFAMILRNEAFLG